MAFERASLAVKTGRLAERACLVMEGVSFKITLHRPVSSLLKLVSLLALVATFAKIGELAVEG